jgi:hypothetical protein
MYVFRQLRLLLDCSLKFSVSVSEQPLEYRLLDLLVILFLKELILKKRHRAEHKELSTLGAHIECCHRAVSRIAHWA